MWHKVTGGDPEKGVASGTERREGEGTWRGGAGRRKLRTDYLDSSARCPGAGDIILDSSSTRGIFRVIFIMICGDFYLYMYIQAYIYAYTCMNMYTYVYMHMYK